jgi:hypothetical protein
MTKVGAEMTKKESLFCTLYSASVSFRIAPCLPRRSLDEGGTAWHEVKPGAKHPRIRFIPHCTWRLGTK